MNIHQTLIKKIIPYCIIILLISWSNILMAKEAYIKHVIVNHYVKNGLDYELNGPNSAVYKGYLNPGEITRLATNCNEQAAYGSYFLRYTICNNNWFKTCKSYSHMLLIKQNEEVIWEITPEGVKTIEIN